jgi:protein-disulfide isomerase
MVKRSFAAIFLLCALAGFTCAQDLSSVLKPPKGAPVAIVIFEDLQCPQCARTAPLIDQAEKSYKIPVVTYDFPLPMHNWSYQAAIFAHYFDSRSKELGHDYRDYIFQNQMDIIPSNLRTFTEKFAAAHKVELPFVIDPQGKFAAEINASRDLGRRVGIEHTPTVYVVSSKPQGPHVVEVKDPHTQLFQMIDAIRQ